MLNYQLIERYGILVIALEFMTMGIIFTIHGNLGITPISCPVYVLSLGFSPTLGEFTIAMHVLFVIIQIILLRTKFEYIQLLQIPLGIIFGILIDVNNYIMGNIYPSSYFGKLIFICIGSFSCAIGVSIEVTVKTVLIAGEGLLLAIITVFNLPLGKTKIAFDSSLLLISVIISLYLFGEIKGVREGTIIAAFLVGFFAGYTTPVIGPFLLNILYRKCPEKRGEKEFNNNLFIEKVDDKLEQNKLDNILV
jgi:uncharacterized membrane protein YczE